MYNRTKANFSHLYVGGWSGVIVEECKNIVRGERASHYLGIVCGSFLWQIFPRECEELEGSKIFNFEARRYLCNIIWS